MIFYLEKGTIALWKKGSLPFFQWDDMRPSGMGAKYDDKAYVLSQDFDRIYLLYYQRMLRFAEEFSLSLEDAENIVQDIFVVLWENRFEIEVKTNMSSYLLSMVKYRCIDYVRRQTTVEKYQQEYSLKLLALEQMNEDGMSEEELYELLESAMQKLPEKCRKIFFMSRFEEKKNKEIAEALNVSVSTVETQIGIALKKLRAELKDYLPLLLWYFYHLIK